MTKKRDVKFTPMKRGSNRMLYSIDSGKYVTRMPHKKDFDKWMKNLSAADYQAITDTLNEKIDELFLF